jgi:hypothetical protein
VKDRFEYNLDRIDVSIYDSKEELREEGRSRSRYASWIAGIYEGEIRIVAEREDEAPESLYIILTHELIHLAVDAIGMGGCPWWLDEGLAVFLSQELPREHAEILDAAVRGDRTFPLAALARPLPDAQVADLAAYLVGTSGWNSVRDILHQCGRREVAAILSDLGLNDYLIEQGWKRWRRNRVA